MLLIDWASDDETGEIWEPTWEPASLFFHCAEAAEAIAAFNQIDEADPSILENDARVNALLEPEPALCSIVVTSAAHKGTACLRSAVVSALRGDSPEVRVEGGPTLTIAKDEVVSLAPPPTTAKANDLVRAVVPCADETERQWYYGRIVKVATGARVVQVDFDDGSRDWLAVYDVQHAQSHAWLAAWVQ